MSNSRAFTPFIMASSPGDVAVVEAGAGLHLKNRGQLPSVHFVCKNCAAAMDLKIDYLDKNGFGRFARR
jgi:hypothetical protein